MTATAPADEVAEEDVENLVRVARDEVACGAPRTVARSRTPSTRPRTPAELFAQMPQSLLQRRAGNLDESFQGLVPLEDEED